ncbi:MAG: hypothetical protein K1X75_12210 [Leptospirales bacterium]|nr:hypothetical protein [Leptospirales bacterium]
MNPEILAGDAWPAGKHRNLRRFRCAAGVLQYLRREALDLSQLDRVAATLHSNRHGAQGARQGAIALTFYLRRYVPLASLRALELRLRRCLTDNAPRRSQICFRWSPRRPGLDPIYDQALLLLQNAPARPARAA